MNKHELKVQMQDAIRSTKHEKKIVEYADVMNFIPSIVDAIEVDRGYIAQNILEHASSGNPINLLLSLVGLRLVSERSLEVDPNSSNQMLNDALRINNSALTSTIEDMADTLAAHEAKATSLSISTTEKINALTLELSHMRDGKESAEAVTKRLIYGIAKRVQTCLSLTGPGPYEGKLEQEITELMEDLQLKACWEPAESNLASGELFIVLKIAPEDASLFAMKPCILRNGEVVAQGVRYEVEPEADTTEK